MSRKGVSATRPTEEEMSERLRRIATAVNAGATQGEIARQMHLGTATISRYIRRGREQGLISPDRGRRGRRGMW